MIDILYIQHAHIIGGSVHSLKLLISDSNRYYSTFLLTPNKNIKDHYNKENIGSEIFGLPIFYHNTAYFYNFSFLGILRLVKVLLTFFVSIPYFLKKISSLNPRILHLNSSTLFLYLPVIKIFKPKIKTVIHIRENIVHGYFGIRKYLISRIIENFSDSIICISEVEASILKIKSKKLNVIYNYVNIPRDLKHITYNGFLKVGFLGGLQKIKCTLEVLKAISIYPEKIELMILGANEDDLNKMKFNDPNYYNQIKPLISKLKQEKKLVVFKKTTKPLFYLNECNTVLFLARLPHFPRPVFEGWMLGKPVIYYNSDFQSEHLNNNNLIELNEINENEILKKLLILNKSYEEFLNKFQKTRNISVEKFSSKNFYLVKKIYDKQLI